MSKAYDMIFESLNEIINDLEENDGKNLKREVVTKEKPDTKKILIRDKQNFSEGIIEHRI
ncbi:MAG: hypothetical protein IKT98_07510 [Selenomonadaceae bacterium]|nr:hypothetical protein [Selenomonadaceae bacterium]